MNNENVISMTGLVFLALIGVAICLTPLSGHAQTATDVVCANCVDRSDLAAKSVSAAKIGNSAVTTDKLAVGAVTTNKIGAGAVSRSKLRSAAVSTGKLADAAVTTEKLADDAVTFEKLAIGAVSAESLMPDAVFFRIRLVRADGTPTENCDALRGALAAITDNGASSRYLISMEPGNYACGTTSVVMKPFVDLRGSGQITTLLTGAVQGFPGGLMVGASNSELSEMTVQNTGTGAGDVAAVRSSNTDDFRIYRVTAIADGTSTFSRGIVILDGTAAVTDSTAIAAGTSINDALAISFGAHVEISGAIIQANTGAGTRRGLQVAQTSSANVRDSVLDGTNFSASVIQSSTVNMAGSQLVTAPEVSAATLKCVYAYNGTYDPLSSTCF